MLFTSISLTYFLTLNNHYVEPFVGYHISCYFESTWIHEIELDRFKMDMKFWTTFTAIITGQAFLSDDAIAAAKARADAIAKGLYYYILYIIYLLLNITYNRSFRWCCAITATSSSSSSTCPHHTYHVIINACRRVGD